MIDITIEGLDPLLHALDNADSVIRRESELTVGSMATRTKERVQANIEGGPRIDEGTLYRGINFQIGAIPGGVEAVVKPSSTADRYAIFVEEDTRPHWPPPGALAGWADRHGIPEFLVRKAIAEHGTEGIHMFAEAYEELLKGATADVARLGVRIIRRLVP